MNDKRETWAKPEIITPGSSLINMLLVGKKNTVIVLLTNFFSPFLSFLSPFLFFFSPPPPALSPSLFPPPSYIAEHHMKSESSVSTLCSFHFNYVSFSFPCSFHFMSWPVVLFASKCNVFNGKKIPYFRQSIHLFLSPKRRRSPTPPHPVGFCSQ